MNGQCYSYDENGLIACVSLGDGHASPRSAHAIIADDHECMHAVVANGGSATRLRDGSVFVDTGETVKFYDGSTGRLLSDVTKAVHQFPYRVYLVEESDLVHVGSYEGEPIILPACTIIAENEAGYRWSLSSGTFLPTVRTDDYHEEGYSVTYGVLPDVIKCARLYARIVRAIGAGEWAGPSGNPYWAQIDPRYGSDAYVEFERCMY